MILSDRGSGCVVHNYMRDVKGMPFSDALGMFSLLVGPMMIHKRR